MAQIYMSKKRLAIYISVSVLITFIIFCVALMVGQYKISLGSFFKAVFTSDESVNMERSIIINLRLPRTILAALTGIALSLSGLIYQDVFQNKLTSPDLLGVSTGASVGAAIAILLGLSSVFISVFAFIAGVATVLITVGLAKLFKNGHTITLIFSGIIVGGFMSAILSFIKFLSDPTTTLATITMWLMGSFQNATMNQIYILGPIVAVSAVFLILYSFRMNVVALGRDEAQTKGVNYKVARLLLIGVATLLTATSVAFCGVVSWIGLVIPHLVRLLVGRQNERTIPLAIFIGATFMIIVDIISRVFTKQEMPLSAVTGLLGTVLFVAIVLIKRRSKHVS